MHVPLRLPHKKTLLLLHVCHGLGRSRIELDQLLVATCPDFQVGCRGWHRDKLFVDFICTDKAKMVVFTATKIGLNRGSICLYFLEDHDERGCAWFANDSCQLEVFELVVLVIYILW